MKKIIYLSILFSLTFILFSCSSDDNPKDEINNFIKIQNDEYLLGYGLSEDYGVFSSDIYNVDLTFLSTGFTVNGNSYSGNGYGVYFEIFSSIPNKLAVGVYQYNHSQSSLSFDDGVYFDINGSVEIESEIVSGTITVVKSENDYYELTFDCIDDQDRKITGSYTGNVNYTPDLIP